MTTTEDRNPAELRLLDVLLAEELRAPPAATDGPTPSARAAWLAAAVLLLGLAVVAGVLATATRTPVVAPVQDPVDGQREPLMPKTADDLVALLPKLEGVVYVEHRLRADDRRVGAPFVTREPPELVAWMEHLRRSCVPSATTSFVGGTRLGDLRLLLVGRREVHLRYTPDPGLLHLESGLVVTVDQELRAAIEAAATASLRAGQARDGRARDAEDLRAMPATLTALDCDGVPLDALLEQLPRLRALRTLRCRGTVPDVSRALALVPDLRRLALGLECLHADRMGGMAGLGHLEELELDGDMHGRDDPMGLDLRGRPRPNLGALAALTEVLPRLPRLRALHLRSCSAIHPVIDAVVQSQLEELHLTRTQIALDDLRRLRTLPSLRSLTLDLSTQGREGNDAPVLAITAQMPWLRSLNLIGVDPERVRTLGLDRALPECAVAVAPRLVGRAEPQFEPLPRGDDR